MPKLKPDHISPTPAEDAAIEAAVASDPQGWENAGPWRPASEVAPSLVADYRRRRGKQKTPTKVKFTIRLDPDIIEHYRVTGKGWHQRVNDALRKATFER